MGKIKTLSIVAFVLLLVGIVGSIFTFKPMLQQKSISEERVIDGNFSQIEIVTNNTEVEILPASDSTAKIDITGKLAKGSNYDVEANVENSILSIDVKYEQRNFASFFPTSLSLRVYVPESVYESLQIKGDNGEVLVSNVQAKDMNIKTDNGNIELRNVKGMAVKTETKNGGNKLSNVTASNINVKSDNGKIKLENSEGNISAKAKNGSISLVTNHLEYPIEFETDNGNIHIQTKEKPTNATFNTSVENGKVDVFNSSNTVFGNGEYLIHLSSNNGSITVETK